MLLIKYSILSPLFFLLAFGIEPHPFLFKETEHSLDKKTIILMYHNRQKGNERTGYCYMDDKKIHYLKIFLCGYSDKVKPSAKSFVTHFIA